MMKRINKTTIIRIIIGMILLVGLIRLLLVIYEGYADFGILYDKKLTVGIALKMMYYSRSFFFPMVLLLALIGFFTYKPMGWILIVSFFTFFLAFMYLISFPLNNYSWHYYFFGLIPVCLITLMNQRGILKFYNIRKEHILTINLIAIVLGLIFTFLWGYLTMYPGKGVFEVIYGN